MGTKSTYRSSSEKKNAGWTFGENIADAPASGGWTFGQKVEPVKPKRNTQSIPDKQLPSKKNKPVDQTAAKKALTQPNTGIGPFEQKNIDFAAKYVERMDKLAARGYKFSDGEKRKYQDKLNYLEAAKKPGTQIAYGAKKLLGKVGEVGKYFGTPYGVMTELLGEEPIKKLGELGGEAAKFGEEKIKQVQKKVGNPTVFEKAAPIGVLNPRKTLETARGAYHQGIEGIPTVVALADPTSYTDMAAAVVTAPLKTAKEMLLPLVSVKGWKDKGVQNILTLLIAKHGLGAVKKAGLYEWHVAKGEAPGLIDIAREGVRQKSAPDYYIPPENRGPQQPYAGTNSTPPVRKMERQNIPPVVKKQVVDYNKPLPEELPMYDLEKALVEDKAYGPQTASRSPEPQPMQGPMPEEGFVPESEAVRRDPMSEFEAMYPDEFRGKAAPVTEAPAELPSVVRAKATKEGGTDVAAEQSPVGELESIISRLNEVPRTPAAPEVMGETTPAIVGRAGEMTPETKAAFYPEEKPAVLSPENQRAVLESMSQLPQDDVAPSLEGAKKIADQRGGGYDTLYSFPGPQIMAAGKAAVDFGRFVKDWVVGGPEWRMKWWDENISTPFKKPLPPEIKNTAGGRLAWKAWEGFRDLFITDPRMNPVFFDKIIKTNPQLAHDIIYGGNKVRAELARWRYSWFEKTKNMTPEVAEKFTDYSDGVISKQDLMNYLDAQMGKADSKKTFDMVQEAFDLINEKQKVQQEMDLLQKETLDRVNDVQYLTRAMVGGVDSTKIKQLLKVHGEDAPILFKNMMNAVKYNTTEIANFMMKDPIQQKMIVQNLIKSGKKANVELAQAYQRIIDIPEFGDMALMAERLIRNEKTIEGISNRYRHAMNRKGRIDTNIYRARGLEKNVAAKRTIWVDRPGALRAMKKGYEATGRHDFVKGKTEMVQDRQQYWKDKGYEIKGINKDGTMKVSRDYTLAERKAMGEIRDIRYKVADTLTKMEGNVAKAQVFDIIAKEENGLSSWSREKIASKLAETKNDPIAHDRWLREQGKYDEMQRIAQENGFKVVEMTGKGYGKMNDRATYDFIKDEVVDEMATATTDVQKLTRQYYTAWKKSNTVWNPKTHFRNAISNVILAYVGDVNPMTPQGMRAYVEAGRELGWLYKNADKSEFVRNVEATGIPIFDSGLSKEYGRKIGVEIDRLIEETMREKNTGFSGMSNFFNKLSTKLEDLGMKAEDIYSFNEAFFKSVIIKNELLSAKRRGLILDENNAPPELWTKAAEKAQKHLFDYGRTSKAIAWSRQSILGGSPYPTFASKALPLMLETMFVKPWKIPKLLFIANAFNNLNKQILGITDEEERIANENQPAWSKNRGTITIDQAPEHWKRWSLMPTSSYMPIRNKLGQPLKAALGYINPVYDVLGPLDALIPIMNNPVTFTALSLALNKDFRGKEIYDSSMGFGPPKMVEDYVKGGEYLDQGGAIRNGRKILTYLMNQLAPVPSFLRPRELKHIKSGVTSTLSDIQGIGKGVGKNLNYQGQAVGIVPTLMSTTFGVKTTPEETLTALESNLGNLEWKNKDAVGERNKIQRQLDEWQKGDSMQPLKFKKYYSIRDGQLELNGDGENRMAELNLILNDSDRKLENVGKAYEAYKTMKDIPDNVEQ